MDPKWKLRGGLVKSISAGQSMIHVLPSFVLILLSPFFALYYLLFHSLFLVSSLPPFLHDILMYRQTIGKFWLFLPDSLFSPNAPLIPRAPFCHEIWTFARSMSNLSAQFAIFARSAIFVKTATLQGVRFALWFFAWFSIFARFASFVSFATVTLQGTFKFSPNLWRVFFWPDWSFSPLRAFLDTSAACRSTSLHSQWVLLFSNHFYSSLLHSTYHTSIYSTLHTLL